MGWVISDMEFGDGCGVGGGSYGISQSTPEGLQAEKVLMDGQREIGEACADEVDSGHEPASMRTWRDLWGLSEGHPGSDRTV